MPNPPLRNIKTNGTKIGPTNDKDTSINNIQNINDDEIDDINVYILFWLTLLSKSLKNNISSFFIVLRLIKFINVVPSSIPRSVIIERKIIKPFSFKIFGLSLVPHTRLIVFAMLIIIRFTSKS